MHRHRPVAALATAVSLAVFTGCATLGGGGGEESEDTIGSDATATMRTAEGRVVGQIDVTDTPQDAVLLRVTLSGGVLQPGTHGFHVHQIGECTPDFAAAGDHYAPYGNQHGAMHPEGKHAGDLPNVHLESTGRTEFEILAQGLTTRAGATGTLFDDDGSAFVLHAGRDDYRSQPSGDAGDPVACGVIRRR